MKRISLVVLFMFIAGCFGNANVKKDEVELVAYRALVISNVTYDGCMRTLVDLENRGLVTREDSAKARKVASDYHRAWNELKQIVYLYVKWNDASAEDQIKVAVENVIRLIDELDNFVGDRDDR